IASGIYKQVVLGLQLGNYINSVQYNLPEKRRLPHNRIRGRVRFRDVGIPTQRYTTTSQLTRGNSGFDTALTRWWDWNNRGVRFNDTGYNKQRLMNGQRQWKDIRHRYIESQEEE
ncbi:MAG: hypothetical protein Q9174_003621, partial [Haloplaca sp. 1 TL-2023]